MSKKSHTNRKSENTSLATLNIHGIPSQSSDNYEKLERKIDRCIRKIREKELQLKISDGDLRKHIKSMLLFINYLPKKQRNKTYIVKKIKKGVSNGIIHPISISSLGLHGVYDKFQEEVLIPTMIEVELLSEECVSYISSNLDIQLKHGWNYKEKTIEKTKIRYTILNPNLESENIISLVVKDLGFDKEDYKCGVYNTIENERLNSSLTAKKGLTELKKEVSNLLSWCYGNDLDMQIKSIPIVGKWYNAEEILKRSSPMGIIGFPEPFKKIANIIHFVINNKENIKNIEKPEEKENYIYFDIDKIYHDGNNSLEKLCILTGIFTGKEKEVSDGILLEFSDNPFSGNKNDKINLLCKKEGNLLKTIDDEHKYLVLGKVEIFDRELIINSFGIVEVEVLPLNLYKKLNVNMNRNVIKEEKEPKMENLNFQKELVSPIEYKTPAIYKIILEGSIDKRFVDKNSIEMIKKSNKMSKEILEKTCGKCPHCGNKMEFLDNKIAIKSEDQSKCEIKSEVYAICKKCESSIPFTTKLRNIFNLIGVFIKTIKKLEISEKGVSYERKVE